MQQTKQIEQKPVAMESAISLGSNHDWVDKFITVFQRLSAKNIDLIDTIYHQKITFTDPIHKVEGLLNLKQYLAHLYQNLSQCDFDITEVIASGNTAAIYWQMHYRHPKLNKGKLITVNGSSHLKMQDNLVIYHRDYLDLGEMLYEQLPFMGRVVKWIKEKASN